MPITGSYWQKYQVLIVLYPILLFEMTSYISFCLARTPKTRSTNRRMAGNRISTGTESRWRSDYTCRSSLFVDDENNLVLFFMEAQEGVNPATCPLGNLDCSKYFLSATEVSGSQGSVYSIDDGVRIEIQLSDSQRIAADPDIFRGPDGYYQYVSRGQNIQVFFSPDLRGTYHPLSTLDDGILTRGGGGVPAGHYDFEQDLFFYLCHHNHRWSHE